jgi:hypothetical protein
VNHLARAGDVVGTRKAHHFTVKFNGEHYQLHRIAWAIAHGEDPGELVIDHINRDGFDNRLTNLRKATYSENSYNRKRKSGKLLPKGVSKAHKSDRYQAFISVDGKTVAIGTYDTPEQAAAAYSKAAKEAAPDFYFSEIN